LLVSTCRPLFLGADDNNQASPLSPSELLLAVSDVLAAAAFKMKEQARQDMAEEDLGGGMFDEDVRDMREAASKCSEPQVYDADEQETLDEQLAFMNAPPPKSLKKFRTGTPLYQAQVAYSSSGFEVRVQMSVRAPVEQVVAWFNARASQFSEHMFGSEGTVTVIGERRNDHSVVVKQPIPMPSPFVDREGVGKSLWKKLDDDVFFVSQVSCQHDDFPPRKTTVRTTFKRVMKLTRISAKITGFETIMMLDLEGSVPRWVNNVVTAPYAVASQTSLARYFISVRPSDAFDEGDATILGQLMYIELHPHRQNMDLLNKKLLDMIRTTNVLRSAQAKYRYANSL
jgi:hypothetical protein